MKRLLRAALPLLAAIAAPAAAQDHPDLSGFWSLSAPQPAAVVSAQPPASTQQAPHAKGRSSQLVPSPAKTPPDPSHSAPVT